MTMQNIKLILNAGIDFTPEETDTMYEMMLTSLSKLRKHGEPDEDIMKCARELGEWKTNCIIKSILK